MAIHKALVSLAAVAATTMLLTSCAAGSATPSDPGAIEGSIIFLTNRTDLKTDGTWDAYVGEFQKTYPDVKVTVEALTSYADDVVTRMSTPNGYGDVLLIPASVPSNQYSDFFEPLGSTDELSGTYRFQDSSSFEGTSYGIALGGNANGVLYNTEVFAEAGIAELPQSPDDFLAALSAIDEKTDAIPYYTNYKDGWPLGGQWTENIGAISGDAEARVEMANESEPWTPGNDVYAIDSLIYDVVKAGLSEPDPLTTNWEQSKNDFATGKIGSMVLGSWAISQFRSAAADAGASDDAVGFMAFPANVDGQQYASVGADYNLAINANSSKKAAARAWIDWLVQESGFTQTQGMISAVEAEPLPDTLSSLADKNVELIEVTPAPKLNVVADESKIDLSGNIYRQKLIDIARGQADGDMKSYFASLNERWGAAVTELAG